MRFGNTEKVRKFGIGGGGKDRGGRGWRGMVYRFGFEFVTENLEEEKRKGTNSQKLPLLVKCQIR
jgi:hypothetical protein